MATRLSPLNADTAKFLRPLTVPRRLILALGGSLTPTWAAEEIPKLHPPEDLISPTFWELHALGVSLAAGGILLGLALIVWWWFRPKPVVPVSPETAARRALEPLRHRPEDFTLLSDVSRLLRRYLAGVLPLSSAELTTEELVGQLGTAPLLGPELATALIDFFRTCDAKKFSPQPPPSPLGAVDRAVDFIRQVEACRRPSEPSPAPADPVPPAPAATRPA